MFAAALTLLLVTDASAGIFRRKKYENPIDKDTQQPDKVLFDKAIKDIEKSKFEVARITLNTLINTYDTSEFLAKAKLAIADSWFREGGSHGLAQAEAEYKDFILFYPTLEESAESQEKICMIHYRQMEKPDRDPNQAMRAEQECRTLLTQFPNSKFAPIAEQRLREIQEVLAEGEYRTGSFYHKKGSNVSATTRFQGIVEQYPLYSGADMALWKEADSYLKMPKQFRAKAGDALQAIVKDYPLSPMVDPAKKKLTEMEMTIPDPDQVALARMKYEQENRSKPGMISSSLGFLKRGPDTYMAAKSGTPAMKSTKPLLPASIPAAAAAAGFIGDVTATASPDASSLDNKKDDRLNPPKPEGETPAAEAVKPADDKATATDAKPADAPAAPAAKDSKKKKKKKDQ
ncbi:MAG: outer membrane protein assembly factor BamD [Bryobacteraceae bacterium]